MIAPMAKKSIGTHDGKFHADEAFACALLQMTDRFAQSQIHRTRDESLLTTMDVVVDVGGIYDAERHRYDHHQPTFNDTFSPRHKTLLSSAGLIYKHFAKEIIAKARGSGDQEDALVLAAYERLYDSFVEAFDAHDNGIAAYPEDIVPRYQRPWDIFAQVNILNPAWNESVADGNERFLQAVALVKTNFEAVLANFLNAWLPGRTIVERCFLNVPKTLLDKTVSDDRVLVLDQFCPWIDHIFELEKQHENTRPLLYAIYQDSTKRSWRVHAVPKSSGSFECRLHLPKAWCGLRDKELDEVSGLKDCIFVHRSGFIGAHATKEGAIAMAESSIRQQSDQTL